MRKSIYTHFTALTSTLLLAALLCTTCAIPSSLAQPTSFKAEFMGQFNASAEKLVSLAEAMPADAYDWQPMEGVATVAGAYMHVARYNYYYPETSLGIDTPAGVHLDTFESTEDKASVVAQLRRSMDHVRSAVEAIPEEEFEAPTELYGRTVTKRAVLLQLITHMNEHLGQQIAYARSNRVVPPWSQ
ncbi:MAG: DinB family protein [Rhodothermales bacterium]